MEKLVKTQTILSSSLLFFLIAVSGCFKPGIKDVSIAKWKNNAKAAYTITHDDLCDSSTFGIFENADTIAYNRGIKFGTGAIVKNCVNEGEYMWDHVRRLSEHGHEIMSHSWDHGSCVDLGWTPEAWDLDTDVVMSREVIEKNVPGAKVTYMAFPFDAYNDQRKAEIRDRGYLGSRSGKIMYDTDRGVISEYESFDPFSSCYFDSYYSKKEQDIIYTEPDTYSISVYNDDNDDVEIQHLDTAIAIGGWSIQEMHSVADKEPWGWGHITIAKYRALCDYAKSKVDAGLLWIETPTAVIKYIMTNNQAGDAVLTNNTISFSTPDKIDKRYATDITLIIKTSMNPKEIVGTQGNVVIIARKVDRNQYLLDVNPLMGDIVLSVN